MPAKGTHLSEEAKAKVSAAQKGRKKSQEEIEKGIASKTGFKHTKEAKEKISKAAKERTEEQNKHTGQNAQLVKSVHRAVEPTFLDCLREKLVEVDETTGHKYYEDFISSFLNEAKDNPNSQACRMLASGLFNENTLSKLDTQINKMMAKDIEFARYRIRNTLFDKQWSIYDNHTDKEIIAICSRRAGKSEVVGRRISSDCLEPNTPVLYVNLTFDNAIQQMYDKVLEMANLADLQLSRASKAAGFIEFANGSSVKFRGNANNDECNKILGFKYRRVYIDEVQNQRNMKYMMNDVISPLTKDYADSQIIYTGTPPRIPHTYCERLWNMPIIKKYKWTMFDNPYIPNKESIIKEECEKRGIEETDSVIQREFYGNWVWDTEAQVFKNRTYYNTLPNVIWDKAYIGVDYGDADYNAVVLCLKAGNKLYIINESKFHRSTVSELINVVISFREEAKKYIKEERNIKIICDTNKKDISREMELTYGIRNVFDAYKVDKDLAIDQLSDFMRAGYILMKKGLPFDDECDQIVHPRDPDTDAILPGIDDVYHPDVMDAVLYVSREYIADANIKVDFHNKQAKEVK